ncbi:MAG: ABC transporter permease [Paraclostridium sp.]
MQNKKEYIKREKHRKLRKFKECSTGDIAWVISLLLSIVLIMNSLMIVGGIYLLASIIQYVISSKVKKEISINNEISKSTRKLGYVLLPFVLVGNIFTGISGLTLIKKEKGIEYTLSIYMVLITISTILISVLNLFKPYVANTYYIGMGILLAVTVFYIFTMIMISKYINGKQVDKKLKPIGVVLILTAFTGNIFALVLGLVILRKLRNKDSEISIEWIDVLRRLFRNDMAIIGLFIVVLLMSLSICSYLTFDYSIAIDNNYSTILLSPNLQYPLGTDDYGRCVFTRIVFGARISLSVGVVATMVPIIIGGTLGAISGYYGRNVDNIIMRILDVLYAVPGILLAIAIVAAFGASTFNLILALSIGGIPGYARTVRATVLSISHSEFVEAARACGAKDYTIIFKHIIPNSLAPIIVRATLGIGGAVLSTSSLSYLGLGVEPHIPEWGNILKIGSNFLETNPYLAIYPGIAIIMIVLAFNFFGDGIRDALDPKLK